VLADDAWLPSHPGRYVNLATDWVLFSACRLLSEAEPPQALHEAIRDASPRPVLIIAGGEVPDEGRAAAYFRQTSPDNVEVWEVEGASHTGGLASAPDEWESRVVGFLDASLRLD
jgi:hypothetical protein